jgi:hypothetical protein
VERFIPLIFSLNPGHDFVDGVRILPERLPLRTHRQYPYNRNNRVSVYLLEFEGDAFLPWFLVLPGAKILSDVDERSAWML